MIWLRTGQFCRSSDGNAGGVQGFRAWVDPELQKELLILFSSDPEPARQHMVELAAGKGMTLTTEEVGGYLRQLDEESEFDNIELDAVALAAIAGGSLKR